MSDDDTDFDDHDPNVPRPALVALPGGRSQSTRNYSVEDFRDAPILGDPDDIARDSLADLQADLADDFEHHDDLDDFDLDDTLHRDPAPDEETVVDLSQPVTSKASTTVDSADYGTPVELARTLSNLADDLEYLSGLAAGHEAVSISPRTRDAYESDWRQYVAWCGLRGEETLPVDPMIVRLYLADMAQTLLPDGSHRFKASTIERHLASLAWVSRANGGDRHLARHPRVAAVLAGIKRGRAEKPSRRQPLLLDDVVRLVEDMDHTTWPSGVIAARDTFAIMLGFATAMRRSEVAGLNVGDIDAHTLDGLHVRLGVTKTDQEGQGAVLGVPYGEKVVSCVPCARVRWLRLLAASGRGEAMRLVLATGTTRDWKHVCRGKDPVVEHGIDPATPLFQPVSKEGLILDRRLTPAALNAMVKRRAESTGYDPDRYGYHSLRAGFVTQARRNGAESRSVRRQTRHGSDQMVDVYDRDFAPLRDNAVTLLGM